MNVVEVLLLIDAVLAAFVIIEAICIASLAGKVRVLLGAPAPRRFSEMLRPGGKISQLYPAKDSEQDQVS